MITTTPAVTIAAATRAVTGPAVAFTGFFNRPAFQYGLAGEPNLASAVNIGDHDHDLIAQLNHILD
jgi:hypothetical protein